MPPRRRQRVVCVRRGVLDIGGHGLIHALLPGGGRGPLVAHAGNNGDDIADRLVRAGLLQRRDVGGGLGECRGWVGARGCQRGRAQGGGDGEGDGRAKHGGKGEGGRLRKDWGGCNPKGAVAVPLQLRH